MSETGRVTIHEGRTYVLKTGAEIKVRKVQGEQAWICRADGKFPRAVSLAWLESKVKETRR